MQLPIQMRLSEKQKTFSLFFVPFLESTSNFKHFEKNIIVTANVFPKLQTLKILVRPFLESISNLKHFEKHMILTANVFPKLETVKIFLRKLSQEHRFRTGFKSQYVKASQMLANFP